MSRPRQAAHTLISTLLLAALCACHVEPPCPDGIHEGSLFMEDNEYFASGGAFGGRYSYGRVGLAGVEDCREINGSLVFLGGISSFADFDGLEVVRGSVAQQGTGYPVGIANGGEHPMLEGFESLVQIDGSLSASLIQGMTALERIGGDHRGGGVSLFSLREVGGHMGGSGDGSLAHLGALETVGGDFNTAFGDLDSLVGLRSIGRDVLVSFADEVTFVLPALESVGRDLSVRNNDAVADVAVPSLRSIGGFLRFTGNRNVTGVADVSARAREAFANVDVGGLTLICRNGPDDPCPYDDECWDFYDEGYCCPQDMGVLECLETL